MLKRALPSCRVTFSPASLTALAVRTVSVPVELPDAPAGALTLIDATPLVHLHLAAPDGDRLRAVATGGRGVRRPVDGLEAVEDVELPDIGHD